MTNPEHDLEWILFDPRTQTYKTKDGTSVSAELVDNVQCLADVLRIAQIRELQRFCKTREKP